MRKKRLSQNLGGEPVGLVHQRAGAIAERAVLCFDLFPGNNPEACHRIFGDRGS
jgi:hypothetical protein